MKTLKIVLTILVFTWLLLLVFDFRVLISETKVKIGERKYVDGHGEVYSEKQESLICKYFNGRKVFETVFWYSSDNFLGIDSCRFLIKVE